MCLFSEQMLLTVVFYLPQLTISSQHQRHHRFCLRLLLKHPDNHALSVLCGHNAMVSGSFKHALGTKHTQTDRDVFVRAFKTFMPLLEVER